MTLEEIRAITEYFKSVGVTQFEANGLKVVFDPRAFDFSKQPTSETDAAKLALEFFKKDQQHLQNLKEIDDNDLYYSVD